MKFSLAVKRLIAENSENLELSDLEKKFCKYAAFQAYKNYHVTGNVYNTGREINTIFKRLFGFDFNPGENWVLGAWKMLEVPEKILTIYDMAYISSVLNKDFYNFSDVARNTYRAYQAVGSMDKEDLDDRGVRVMGRIFIRVLESFKNKGNKKLDKYMMIRNMKSGTKEHFGDILNDL
jgi:hypothetical protein